MVAQAAGPNQNPGETWALDQSRALSLDAAVPQTLIAAGQGWLRTAGLDQSLDRCQLLALPSLTHLPSPSQVQGVRSVGFPLAQVRLCGQPPLFL